MSYTIALLVEGTPLEHHLEQLLDVLANINAAWFLEQWRSGARPPASARAAGVIWQPDRPSQALSFQSAPIVFRDGVASCGPIAAISVGYQRAVERASGRSAPSATQRHRIDLVLQRPNYWHAMHRTPWGLEDPTQGMRHRP